MTDSSIIGVWVGLIEKDRRNLRAERREAERLAEVGWQFPPEPCTRPFGHMTPVRLSDLLGVPPSTPLDESVMPVGRDAFDQVMEVV